MLFLRQGEDGEAGDPGLVGEPGPPVSDFAFIFSFLLLLRS